MEYQPEYSNRFRIYAGPTTVQRLAEQLSLHFHVDCVGVAHVYVSTNFDAQYVLDSIGRGRGWTLRDVLSIR